MKKIDNSRHIAFIHYEPKDKILEVHFKNGGVYHYSNYPEHEYKAFETAKSHGEHFHKNVVPRYRFTKVR